MNNAEHQAADVTDESAEHPAGEMALAPKSRASARVRALAGLTLAAGAFYSVAGTLTFTTVSVEQ